MYAAMTLCGQKERRPHLTGGGKFPEATPHHQVDGATPISLRLQVEEVGDLELTETWWI